MSNYQQQRQGVGSGCLLKRGDRLSAGTIAVLIGGAIAAVPGIARSADLPQAESSLVSYAELLPLLPDPAALLPPFPSFNSPRLDLQIRLYASYVATQGVPDVLVVGSSRALQGLDPDALRRALAEHGYGQLRVYNFSINGATAQVVRLMLQQILPASHRPRVIIWADGSRAFNSARTDLTYNGIVASPGYQRLSRGDRPLPDSLTLALPQEPPKVCLEPTDWQALAAAAAERSAGFAADPESLSPLLAVGLTAAAAAGAGCDPFLEPALPAPAQVAPLQSPTAALESGLNRSGFEPIAARFVPTTYYQRFPRVSGRYDDNYAPFRLAGVQTTAAVAIAATARSRQTPLIFVNLPLTQDYLDPVRRAYEQQFRQHLRQLSTRHGFLFRDLSLAWPTQNQYFADPSHINQAGAAAVARLLANDPGIPWATWLRRSPRS